MPKSKNIPDIEIPSIQNTHSSISKTDATITQQTSATQTTTTSAINTQQQQQPYPTSKSIVSFSAWSRVFFQSRDDRGSRQVLPSHCPTYTSNRDTYLYVVIDESEQNLFLFPDENKMNHHKPIVNIDLKYFDAQVLPNSHSCVALFARTEPYHDIENDSDTNTPTNKSASSPEKKNPILYKRYVFRFEFLNTVVSQPQNRIHALQASARNVKRFQKPDMITKFNMAGKNWLSSHDDIEENRKIEEKKNIDAHHYYMTLIEEFVSDSAGLAKRFSKLVNAATTLVKPAIALNTYNSNMHVSIPAEDEKLVSSARVQEGPTDANYNFDLEGMLEHDHHDVHFDSDESLFGDESSLDDNELNGLN